LESTIPKLAPGVPARIVKVRLIDGLEAVRLWWKYVDAFDLEALNTLLQYNKEDVMNLKILKDKIC